MSTSPSAAGTFSSSEEAPWARIKACHQRPQIERRATNRNCSRATHTLGRPSAAARPPLITISSHQALRPQVKKPNRWRDNVAKIIGHSLIIIGLLDCNWCARSVAECALPWDDLHLIFRAHFSCSLAMESNGPQAIVANVNHYRATGANRTSVHFYQELEAVPWVDRAHDHASEF